MLGAIIGDIVGSRFEFRNHRSKDFELFASGCDFTDDTICTIAVADALLHRGDYTQYIHRWCRRYPNPMGGYGGRFVAWVGSRNPQPYGSFGNGSAMRVSPCGWLSSLEEVLKEAEASASCSHNHPEGVKGAKVIAHAIWLLRHGASKADIQKLAEDTYGYSVSGISVRELQRTNRFDETCQGTIPPALCCFLESTDFEDAIRNAISIGGDSDTIGAIVGGLAEAHYGIPKDLRQEALRYLPSDMLDIINRFAQRIRREDLIKQCRYYKGEEECPKRINSLWWGYEKAWVEFEVENDPDHKKSIEIYKELGLSDVGSDDGVPLGLKAILFNRMCHWSGNISPEEGVELFRASYPFEYLQDTPESSPCDTEYRRIP